MEPMDSKVVLETRNLTKHYGGVHALNDANFKIHEGEHIAIVGDNGAGKSTFVRSITGVETPTDGEIFLNGTPVQFSAPNRLVMPVLRPCIKIWHWRTIWTYR